MSKRTSTAAVTTAPKKQKILDDETQERCDCIIGAIKGCDSLPTNVRKMLIGMMHAFRPYPDDLSDNPIAHGISSLFDDALNCCEEDLRKQVNKKETKTQALLEERAVKQGEFAVAELEREEMQKPLLELKNKLAECTSHLDSLGASVKASQEAMQTIVSAHEELRKKRERLVYISTMIGSLVADGETVCFSEGHTDFTEDHISELVCISQGVGNPESMLSALPATLRKPPSSYTNLDKAVLKQLTEDLTTHIQSLDESSASSTKLVKEHEQKVASCKEDHEKALPHQEMAAAHFTEAEQKALKADKAFKTARNSLHATMLEIEMYSSQCEDTEKRLAQFSEGPRAALRKLLSRTCDEVSRAGG